jgi:hypothetical protein
LSGEDLALLVFCENRFPEKRGSFVKKYELEGGIVGNKN